MFLEKNFIASAKSFRTISMSFDVANAQEDENGQKYIAAGSYYTNGDDSSNGSGSSAGAVRKGIVLDDIYFKDGQTTVVGALVVAGHILKDRLPAEIDDSTIYELAAQGLFFEDSATTVVPEDEAQAFDEDGE